MSLSDNLFIYESCTNYHRSLYGESRAKSPATSTEHLALNPEDNDANFTSQAQVEQGGLGRYRTQSGSQTSLADKQTRGN